MMQTLRERFITAPRLQNMLAEAHNVHISSVTIRKRLRGFNLTPKTPAKGPQLTADHRRARLTFAQEHVNWSRTDWTNVMFSDESRYCQHSSDKRMRVYRRPGERYAQCNIVPTVMFGGGSVMVWGGITLEARTELVVIPRGSITAVSYIANILEPHVMPFAPFRGNDFLFMHDNAKPHSARIVQQNLAEVGITTMQWPARSPDLNPIEHLWDTMGKRLRAHPRRPTNQQGLGQRLQEIWEDISQDEIRTLINSMGRRCLAVIRARGGNTKY
jgi:hypothetical protein